MGIQLSFGQVRAEIKIFFPCFTPFLFSLNKNRAYQHKDWRATVKHGGGRVMIRPCLADKGSEHLAVDHDLSILGSSVIPSKCNKCS